MSCSHFAARHASASRLMHHAPQVDLPDPEDEAEPGGKKGCGSALNMRKEDKQLMELAGRTMNHAER